MKAILPALLAASIVGGCLETPAPVPPVDACGASGFADVVGTPHRGHDFSAPDRTVRIIPPNSAVTLDYRADRLNVNIDKDGRVTRVWCG